MSRPAALHGSRKATATRLADLGATEHQIMAVTDQRSSAEIPRYTRAARRRQPAESSMALLTGDKKWGPWVRLFNSAP